MKFNNETLRVAVREWIGDENKAKEKYGDINDWDTSEVTDMSKLFLDAHEFNSPIGSWDVSNVKTMHAMFDNAFKFDQNINNWDVSNVEDMSEMFSTTQELDFNQPLGNWDVGSVKRMNSMFYNAKLFNHDLSKWNVSNVTNMRGMFDSAKSFNQAIGEWDVSSVKSMNWMFRNAISFNQDIGKWNVSNVVEMSEMFRNAKSFNQAIGEWDVSSVKSMEGMFDNAESFTHSLENWNLKNGISLKELFKDPTLNQLLDGLNDLTDELLNSPYFQSQDTQNALIDLKNKLNNQKKSPEKADVYNESQMEIQRFYFDTGELECEQEVDSNGILNGFVRYYHKNGNLQTEVFWKDGKQLDGQVDSFDEEGNLVRSVDIKNGTQNGEFEEYYPDKKIKRKGVYIYGDIVEEILFDINGNKTIIQLYNKVFSNSEFRQKLNEFKRNNNDNCSFNKISLEFNRWSLTQDLYQIGEFKGYKFIKFCDENVKIPVDDCEYEEIISYKEDDLLNFIGDNELNELCLWYNVELSRVNKLLWEEGTPEDIKEEAENEYSEFFEVPRYNPDEFEELDKTITEFECGFVLNNETFLKSINVELNGINYNSLINWEFSGDNVPEATKKAQIEKNFILIANSIKRYILQIALNINKIDAEYIPILILKTYQKFIVDEINNNYGNDNEQLIFDILSSMFFDYSFGTDSIGDEYDLIETNKFNGISEVRFQIFKEFKPGFTMSDFLNMFICVCIPLTFNDLSENQKNEFEKEKIGEIEKFKSLVESLRK